MARRVVRRIVRGPRVNQAGKLRNHDGAKLPFCPANTCCKRDRRAGGKRGRMQTGMLDVVGIGNAIVDVIAAADDAFLERHGMTKGSMMLIDESRAEVIYAAMGPA